jgi:hypothetical protein
MPRSLTTSATPNTGGERIDLHVRADELADRDRTRPSKAGCFRAAVQMRGKSGTQGPAYRQQGILHATLRGTGENNGSTDSPGVLFAHRVPISGRFLLDYNGNASNCNESNAF